MRSRFEDSQGHIAFDALPARERVIAKQALHHIRKHTCAHASESLRRALHIPEGEEGAVLVQETGFQVQHE